ncbi:MAG: hypothetical protein KAJ51_07535, partial [Thermoplasmata archaeon]|nr:hypothetical protein [Thermoplasmata archaeon]
DTTYMNHLNNRSKIPSPLNITTHGLKDNNSGWINASVELVSPTYLSNCKVHFVIVEDVYPDMKGTAYYRYTARHELLKEDFMPPNEAPMINTTNVQNATEDVYYSVDYDATDIDSLIANQIWSLSTNASSWLNIGSETGILNGTPTNDEVGSYWVIITVDDGEEGFDFTNFTLNVVNVNDPPYWDPEPPDITLPEETSYNVSVKAADSDSTELYFSAYVFTSNASWEITPISGTENNYANFTLNFDDYEVYLDETSGLSINLTVNDGEYYESTIIELEVTNVNDKPELHYPYSFDNKLQHFTAMEDLELDFSLLGIDEDYSEDLEFSYDIVKFPKYAEMSSYTNDKINITALTPGTAEDYVNDYSELMYYNNFTTVVPAEFRFMPDNNDVGFLLVNLTVSDTNYDSASVIANITIENVNDAPYFIKAADTFISTGYILDYTGANNISVGEYLNITIEANDDDLMHGDETLTFSADASLISDGVLTITKATDTSANFSFSFPKAYVGTDIYNITVTDGDETDWFLIDVEFWQGPDGIENDPPVANFTFSPSSP